MNRLDKKQIFIGTILGIILSTLTLILLTRNIQPLSAQQTQPRYMIFKTTAREGFKFMNMNDTRTYVGMQFIGGIPYLATLNATSMLWITVNSSTPGAGFIVFTNKLNPNQQSWLAFTTSSLNFFMNNPQLGTTTYAPIFAQTPTTTSPGNQVVTKEYVLNVVGGSDCPIFTRLNVQGVEKFVCLLGKIVEPVWNAYYGPITPVRYEGIHEERTVVEVKNEPFFKNVLNKPIIGVRAWIDDKYDNTNGVCAILIPNKLAIVLTNGEFNQYAGWSYLGGTIFKPLDVKEFRGQYSVKNCGEWNHIAYGRFWTAYVKSGDRSYSKSEYETPIILFYRFGSAGNYVIEGTSNTLFESSCSPGTFIQSAMSKGFDGDRFYLTENDKIIFDFTAVRRKSNIQFQCAIKFYYIP